MSQFDKILRSIRREAGFKSARSFWVHLRKTAPVDLDYSYYSRIESGAVIPSAKAVKDLSAGMPKALANQLILAYCRSLFPDQRGLFKSLHPVPERENLNSKDREVTLHLRTMTLKQVSAATRTRLHYYIFLVVTLARYPLDESELTRLGSAAKVMPAMKELVEARLLTWTKEDKIRAVAKDILFPPRESSLNELYQTLDQWDQDFAQNFDFSLLKSKFYLRRVSPRFLPAILNAFETGIQLVELADDVPKHLNEEVLYLSFKLHRGNLPG